MCTARFESLLETVLDHLHVFYAVMPQCYSPLIGDNKHAETCTIQFAAGLNNAGQNLEILPGTDVLSLWGLSVDYPIPVEEYGCEFRSG